MIFDNKIDRIILTAPFINEGECKALIGKWIELNRIDDDDDLYLKEIKKL